MNISMSLPKKKEEKKKKQEKKLLPTALVAKYVSAEIKKKLVTSLYE